MSTTDLSAPQAPHLEGWEARFIGSEPRLSEVVDMYREIGFEVLVKSFETTNCEGCCTSCFGGPIGETMTVYTRKVDE